MGRPSLKQVQGGQAPQGPTVKAFGKASVVQMQAQPVALSDGSEAVQYSDMQNKPLFVVRTKAAPVAPVAPVAAQAPEPADGAAK